MFADLSVLFYDLARLARRLPQVPASILLPVLLIVVAWPLLRVGLNDARAAFMVAFVAAIALRFALRADANIKKARRRLSARATVIWTLICGPGLLGVIIWADDPLICQRFLSLYFLGMSALYVLDVIDGRHVLVRLFWPDRHMRAGDAVLTRVLAVYNLAMVLLNETIVQTASQTTWLLYFGLLPLLSHVMMAALLRTVRVGFAAKPRQR